MHNFITFLAGIGIGSVVTWALVKNKYEQIVQEEIDSVKEVFFGKSKEEPESEEEEDIEEEPVDEEFEEYKEKANTYNTTTKKEEKEDMSDGIYVISPEEFGENDFETVTLMYYMADGTLVEDDSDTVLDDDEIETMVGYDAFNHFGEYEDDSVFVRNENLEKDYEILLNSGRFDS